MITNDKPNPFQVLRLPADATRKEIVVRGQELCTEEADKQELYTWAMEQLITKPRTRLEYELFEIPDTRYEDRAWEDFVETYQRNPVRLAVLIKEVTPAHLGDVNLVGLLQLFFDGLLIIPEADIVAAIDNSPFLPGYGPLPLEVRDVIFG